MTYAIILWGLLFGLAVWLGLAAGKKSFVVFWSGMVTLLLCALVLGGLLWLSPESGLELQQKFLPESFPYQPDSVVFLSDIIYPSMNTNQNPWMMTIALVLLAFVLFVIAFNCRKTVENIYMAFGGTLFFSGVIYFCVPWAFHGANAFCWLWQDYSSAIIYLPEAGWIVIGLSLLMLVSWTLYSFRGRRKGWKVLLWQGGLAVGIFAGCWLAALAVIYPYGCHVRAKLEKLGIQPYPEIAELPSEAQAELNRVQTFFRNLELPVGSVYLWNKEAPENKKIPSDKREYALKTFAAPEAEALLSTYENVLKNHWRPSVAVFSLLNSNRNYARVCAGRAALFLETGQEDKILPELRKIAVMNDALLNNPQTDIEELVRISIQTIWYSNMVRLGPDGVQYASAYREALNRMKARNVQGVTELGLFLYWLDSYLHFKDWQGARGYGSILAAPGMIAKAVDAATSTLALEGKRAQVAQNPVFERSDEENEPEQMLRQVAIKSWLCRNMGTAGLALKLYRSEKGVYPETLEQLVPGYLDEVPVCPFTGKPLAYESDGKTFRLSAVGEQQKKLYYLDTERNY
jgi:hypothetical protein